MADVAFIGLGNMGGPMAINLVEAGHTVTVFDLSQAACDQLQEAGASVASTAAEAAVGVDYIISMLPAGKHVAGIYMGEQGLLARVDGSTTILDCSHRLHGLTRIRWRRRSRGWHPGIHVRWRCGNL
jgi:3-hydroxyisobutyrate dehydrogenase